MLVSFFHRVAPNRCSIFTTPRAKTFVSSLSRRIQTFYLDFFIVPRPNTYLLFSVARLKKNKRSVCVTSGLKKNRLFPTTSRPNFRLVFIVLHPNVCPILQLSHQNIRLVFTTLATADVILSSCPNRVMSKLWFPLHRVVSKHSSSLHHITSQRLSPLHCGAPKLSSPLHRIAAQNIIFLHRVAPMLVSIFDTVSFFFYNLFVAFVTRSKKKVALT
jgi:hypothetical protein